VALILNSPNNPSGYVLNSLQLEKLGAWLETTSWWIICDEIYEYLSFERPHVSLFQLCPFLEKRGILVHGFSKGFAMTGWRVGYAAGPSSIIELITSLQSHSSTCLPGFIEDAACVAANAGFPLVKENIDLLNVRRKKAIEQIQSIEKIAYYPPEGAFYLFLDLRALLGKTSSFDFAKNLLQKHFLATVPGEAFGAPGFLRLSYAVHEQTLEEGIQRLKKALSELQL
jgi:aspartate aminotransferase